MSMCLSKAVVDTGQQFIFGTAPELGVMAKSTTEFLPCSNDLIVGKRIAAPQAMNSVGDAYGIIQYSEGIDHGVETQATTDGTYLVGETRAEKEEAIAVGNGLG